MPQNVAKGEQQFDATVRARYICGTMQRLKDLHRLAGIALAGLAVVAILGAAELGARAMAGWSYDGDEQLAMSRPDSRTIWRYRPNLGFSYKAPEFEMQVRTNEDGLRGGSVAGPGDAPTVLFIGDSFTFGWGVSEEQRYSEVLGRMLTQASPAATVRIVNAGHWMYAFDQQLILMKELIARYRPQVVVQDIYWPYIRFLYGHRLTRAADGTLLSVEDSRIDVDARGVVRFRSDLLERPPFGSELVGLGARALFGRDLHDRAADWLSYLRPGDQNADLWARTEMLIDQAVRTTRDSHVAYVPIIVPASIELPGGNWSNVGWTAKSPPADVDVALPGARLAGLFAQRGVEAVVLAAPMQKALGEGASSRFYYPQDGHWNAVGHAVAGKILAPVVARGAGATVAAESPQGLLSQTGRTLSRRGGWPIKPDAVPSR